MSAGSLASTDEMDEASRVSQQTWVHFISPHCDAAYSLYYKCFETCCLQKAMALRVPSDVELPEELTPLVEALEQAQQRVDQVTALREALETKVGGEIQP